MICSLVPVVNVNAICPVVYHDNNCWYHELLNIHEKSNGLESGSKSTMIFTHESVPIVFNVSCPVAGMMISLIHVEGWIFHVEGCSVNHVEIV